MSVNILNINKIAKTNVKSWTKTKKCVISLKRMTQLLEVNDALFRSERGALEQGASPCIAPSVSLVNKG